MSKNAYILAGVGALAATGAALWYYFYVRTYTTLQLQSGGGTADSTLGSIVASVESAVVGWKNVGEAASWLPDLEAAEASYDLPQDLLARIAFEESHFRDEIIRGTLPSPAGALGLMQLEPEYFPEVRMGAPFSDNDVRNQIDAAAREFVHLHQRFGDWKLAIAAYNAGEGEVHKYNGVPPFKETQKYVADVVSDVPSLAEVA